MNFDTHAAYEEMRDKQKTNAGWLFATLVRSIGVAKGDWMMARAYAEGRGWHEVARVCKATVTPVDSTDLVSQMRPFSEDLAAYLRPRTITGQLEGLLRRAPFRTRLLRQTVGGTAAFVGEGHPVPVSTEGIDNTVLLDPLKVVGIRIVTNDLLNNISRGANAMIVDDVGAAIVEAIDRHFVDPTYGGVATVSPASVTHNGTRLSSSGATVAAIDADLKAMITTLVTNGEPVTTAAFVMNPITATNLALVRGSGGAPAYPGISAKGGTLLGLPVVTSAAVSSAGSPGERFIALIECGDILFADEGEARVDVSTNATVQQVDNPVDGPAQGVSLWQANMTGIKTTRYVNWFPRRSGATVVLENVAY